MITDDSKEVLLRYLEFIGLKGYEAKAYLTLLRLGEETAPRIASRSGIPLPRVYDVLESLSRKGLVEVKAGRPRLYRALPPSIALTRYVRSYVERIFEMNRKIVEELEKIYRSKESREPYIWLSHSLEASIERTIDLIKNMKIDGYASLNNELLKNLINPLTRKLRSNKTIPFSLTLLYEPGNQLINRLSLDNIMILVQPTGIVNSYEQDFNYAILFSDSYSLFTTERELLLILNDTYYYGYWRNARIVKEINVRKGDMYKTKHLWIALSIIGNALREGFNVKVNVAGYYVKTHKPVEVKGYAINVYRSPDDRVRSITIEKENGEKIRIGGIGASVEDVEAHYLEINIE